MAHAVTATGKSNNADENGFIDEGLYSRQLYVLGHEAMRRMQNSNVLIVGLKGLGVEIAKNVILAGVKSVTLYDPEAVALADMSAQYYLTEEDAKLGRARDECSQPWLAELNTYVPVRVLRVESGAAAATTTTTRLVPARDLAAFEVVVGTELGLAEQVDMDAWCHANGRCFIAADVRGLFGSVFCDFGEEFVVMDTTGEQPVSGMVSAITREQVSVVTCLEDMRHGLEDGDQVRFREVRGMTELNDSTATYTVKVLSPFTFSIGDTVKLSAYETGGVYEQVKQPVRLSFKSLSESLSSPDFVISDFAKMDRMAQLHVAFAVLGGMASETWPRPRHDEEVQAFVTAARAYAEEHPVNGEVVAIDEALLSEFAQQCRGQLAPMAAVIGGLVAQEVLKACSGKFGPIKQHLYFDSLESLPVDRSTAASDFAADTECRYNGQVSVFGRAFQQRLAEARGFVVGSGAIGCELVKLYALMGIGHVTLTDMDNIEKSNLNRQFLFRPDDVGKPKSLTAAMAAFRINPAVRIDARVDRVGPETEAIFSRAFFAALDFVTNALDNVEARKYVDQQCVLHGRPLLESGTLGTKGNTQVVIPHVTESYSSSQDPPERSIPFCTLHNFPNTIEHTIEWAMDVFQGAFRADPEAANRFLAYQQERSSTAGPVPPEFATQKDRLEAVRRSLFENVPKDAGDCVGWAVRRFQELFSNNIRQLLHNFPLDAVTSSGTPFWSGPKRAPMVLDFDASAELHVDFVEAAARLRAAVYGVAMKDVGREEVRTLAREVTLSEFIPRAGVRIVQTEAEAQAAARSPAPTADTETEEAMQELARLAAAQETVSGDRTLCAQEFEKDDDRNYHIDFVAACANLRAANYGITAATRHKVKGIAGKIIPAIATTTALVAGLVALELYKVIDGPERVAGTRCYAKDSPGLKRHWNVDRFKNGFVNLALPFFAFSSPIEPPRLSYDAGRTHFTLWDAFEVRMSKAGNLRELLAWIEGDYGMTISMLSCGSTVIYSNFMPKHRTPEHLALPLDQLIAQTSRKPIPEPTEMLLLECLAENEAGEDVDVPVIKLLLKE